ncbi:MAG TPA: sugar transferase [Pseudogracilibacillus sp.]|nr:sugar transferase [Pseudogracilibacillus sp.]
MKQREMETVQLVRYSKSYVFFKRILDIVLSTVLLLLLSPVLLLVSLLLYMDDGSPVIFKQTRIGLGEKPFVLLKFRTMPWVAPFLNDEKEDSKKHWIHGVPDDFVFKSSCPSETTKLGEFLRKYSVDELPQLINVVKGDMSLVGPRPEVSNITDYYNVEQKKRLLVKPGLTGYAQVHGRSGLTHGEKISSDLYYVESRSLKLDIRILLLTVKHVFKAENSF